eukprot:365688-Chlamydomonas_euryale.AAC.17
MSVGLRRRSQAWKPAAACAEAVGRGRRRPPDGGAPSGHRAPAGLTNSDARSPPQASHLPQRAFVLQEASTVGCGMGCSATAGTAGAGTTNAHAPVLRERARRLYADCTTVWLEGVPVSPLNSGRARRCGARRPCGKSELARTRRKGQRKLRDWLRVSMRSTGWRRRRGCVGRGPAAELRVSSICACCVVAKGVRRGPA